MMNNRRFLAWLKSKRACAEGVESIAGRDAATFWRECPRGDWLLWWAAKAKVDRKVIVMAACACARTALLFVRARDPRPLKAIETAEAWCRGVASITEVRAAVAAAYAAAYADAAAADAAAAAAAAAAYAYAVDDAADAAYAAVAAAYAYAGVGDDAAWASALAKCADLVREHITFSQIEETTNAK